MEAKDTEMGRQREELQTLIDRLRVNFNFSSNFCAYSQHSLVIGTDTFCRQRQMLDLQKFSSNLQKGMLKSGI